MSVLVAVLAAIAVALALVFGSRFWFGRLQKRRHIERIGIESLSSRHWREPLGLLVDALGKDGLSAQADLAAGHGAPLGERILRRGAGTVLLIYKHGTTYRIASPALLDAEKRRQEAGIDEVVLATLGSVDDDARAQAARMRITCIDGKEMWALVGERLDPATRAAIEAEAEHLIDGPRRLSTVGAAVLGIGIVFWTSDPTALLDRRGDPAAESVAAVAPTPASEAAAAPALPASDAAPPIVGKPSAPGAGLPPARAAGMVAAIPSAVVGEPAATNADDLVAIASALKALPGIDHASWSSASTVVLTVNRRATLDAAHEQICALAAQYPKLREIRLQLEASDGADVRWRRCG